MPREGTRHRSAYSRVSGANFDLPDREITDREASEERRPPGQTRAAN